MPEPILRRQPVVFISSAMGADWTELRNTLSQRIRALSLADDWLFEFHATSGSEPATAQYLDLARSCDLLVLVLGPKRSVPTEDEYHAAFADNPDKVLPFYRGRADEIPDEIRKIIDRRHSRVEARSDDDLVDEVVKAVERSVLEGRVIAGSLRRSYRERLGVLDELLAVEFPLSVLPRVTWGGEPKPIVDALASGRRIALTGPGGSGKTYGAHVALYSRTGQRPRADAEADTRDIVLPLLLRARSGRTDLPELLRAAFEAQKFFPGVELTERYAHEGRLLLAVDGYDELDASGRLALLDSIEDFADRFPRTGLLVVARSLPDERLHTFTRAEMTPLTPEQQSDLFVAAGQQIRGPHDIPDELEDLVRWPFWATALALEGHDIASGLELLKRTIGRRLQAVAPEEIVHQEMLRAALGAVALCAQPGSSVTLGKAFETIDDWSETATQFEAESSEKRIERLRRTGLVTADGGDLEFVHPLIAATLAAEAVAAGAEMPEDSSEEVGVFAAALSDDGDRVREALTGGDLFFRARVLRASYPRPRKAAIASDLERYMETLRQLDGTDERIAYWSGSSVAVRHQYPANGGPRVRELDTFERLIAEGEQSDLVIWQTPPTSTLMPELLAAGEALFRFKRRFVALQPEDDHRSLPEDRNLKPIAELLKDKGKLETTVIERAEELRQHEVELRSKLGLDGNTTLASAEPNIEMVVKATNPENARAQFTWGHERQSFEFVAEDPQYFGMPLDYLVGDALVSVAYEELKGRVEGALGSTIGSAMWNRPEQLAGWNW